MLPIESMWKRNQLAMSSMQSIQRYTIILKNVTTSLQIIHRLNPDHTLISKVAQSERSSAFDFASPLNLIDKLINISGRDQCDHLTASG